MASAKGKSGPERLSGLTWEVPEPLEGDTEGPRLQAALAGPAARHLRAVVGQLCGVAGLEDEGGGLFETLASLAEEASASLSPSAMTAHGDIDPSSYLKVKRLLGDPAESSVIDGVALRKNVAHKRMPTQVVQPRIAIVGGAIEAQKGDDTLSSFDALLDGERQLLEGIVAHVASLNPHVLLVGRSVARHAQDLLLKHGIALVLNVKQSVLKRVALCTGAEVASTAEELSTRGIGFCKEFRVEPARPRPEGDDPAQPPRPLMIFRGCPRPLGATVLLHGRDGRSSALAKLVLRHTVKAAHMGRLETSFLAKQVICAAAFVGKGGVGDDSGDRPVDGTVDCDAEPAPPASAGGPDPLLPLDLARVPRTPEELEAAAAAAAAACAAEAHAGRADGAVTSSSPYVLNFVERGARHESISDLARASLRAGGNSPSRGPGDAEDGPLPDLPPAEMTDRVAEAMYRLWLTISCKNPSKGILCEPAHSHCMRLYDADDLPLGAFLSCAAPADIRCFQPACREGAVLHLRSFMRGNSLITLSCARLPLERSFRDGQVWFWMRPLRPTDDSGAVRRVAMAPDSACLTLAHLLSLLLDVRGFTFLGRNLQADFVRYIASGDIIVCLHYSLVTPMAVSFPPPVLSVAFTAQVGRLEADLAKLASEFDAIVAVAQRLVTERADGEKMEAAVAETRVTAARAIERLRADLCKAQRPQDAVRLLWQLNKLRKRLAWVIHKWAFLLNELSSPPPVLRATDDAEGTVADAGAGVGAGAQAGEAPGLGSPSRPAALPAPRAGESSPQRESAPPIRGTAHRRLGSDSMAGLFATAFGEHEQLERERSQRFTAPAPSLRADPVDLPERAESRHERAAQEDRPDERASEERRARRLIPTGLVARYVSLFQDDGGRGGSVGARAWSGPEWVTSIRRHLREADSEADSAGLASVANFEILGRAPLGLAPTAPGVSPTAVRSESVSRQFEELAVTLDALQPARGMGEALQAIVHEDAEEARATDSEAAPEGTVLGRAQRLTTVLSGRPLLPAGADGVQVTIFDEEPTSIVAYALATSAYKTYVEEAVKSIAKEAGEAAGDLVAPSREDDPTRLAGRVLFSGSAQHCHFTVHGGGGDPGAVVFQVTAYFAPQFHQFRAAVLDGGEAQFLASISRCRKWKSKGGKSNVYFAKTQDDRFVIKQLSKAEKQFILDFVPPYLQYLTAARQHAQESCLARIVGLFQVSVQYTGREGTAPAPFGARDGALDLLVMENIFYDRDISRVYDLKGSERDRYTDDDPRLSGTVLLDENLKEINLSSPTVVGPGAFAKLQRAIWSDTGFLSNLGVMDYSLLVGVDKTKSELVVGVIDFIRQFTLDKALEMYVKKAGILGGGGKDPTVLSPRHYSSRFRAAMGGWLTAVPDGASGIEEFATSTI